jgi:hypothetical protein
MARAMRSFSPIPLLISLMERSAGRSKKSISPRALTASKSAKKRENWETARGGVRLAARNSASGRKETSALDAGPGAWPATRTRPS